jgi:hypothetical protein
MNIEELVPLTNGLSVTTENATLVCDRARLTPVAKDAIDIAFWIAGTDFAPRLRLTRDRVLSSTPEQLAAVVRRVARSAVTYVAVRSAPRSRS